MHNEDEQLNLFSTYSRGVFRTLNPHLMDASALYGAGTPGTPTGDNTLLFAMVMLASEAGEALGWVQKHFWQGHPLNREEVLKEFGDMLWAMTVAADCLGARLQDVAVMNRDKLRLRYPDGFTTAASQARADGTPL